MRMKTLILAAAVMQLIGPRPAFVHTAYAEAALMSIEGVVIHEVDALGDQGVRIGAAAGHAGNVARDVEDPAAPDALDC